MTIYNVKLKPPGRGIEDALPAAIEHFDKTCCNDIGPDISFRCVMLIRQGDSHFPAERTSNIVAQDLARIRQDQDSQMGSRQVRLWDERDLSIRAIQHFNIEHLLPDAASAAAVPV